MNNDKFAIEHLEGQGLNAIFVRPGNVYSSYGEFANACGYPDAYAQGFTPENRKKVARIEKLVNRKVKILARGRHGTEPKTVLYVVEAPTGERFIVNEKGLENIEEDIKSLKEIVESLLKCNYECEAGPLINNEDFRLLAKIAGVELPLTLAESVQAISDAFRQFGMTIKGGQQCRDEIVEQAKRDVASIVGDYDSFKATLGGFLDQSATAKFVVNAKKRTVVALIYGYYSKTLYAKGIAKCAPNDCFNSHIGKAIALRRALELPVPDEYLNAPQPTEVRVGDVVTFPGGINKRVLYRVDDTEKKEDNLTIVRCDVAPSLVGKKANADFTNRDSMLPVVDDSRE